MILPLATRMFFSNRYSEERGNVTVALLDEKGNELPGYGFADSIPITSDAVRTPVIWKSIASLKPLAGHAVRVAMRIRGKAIVYAVAFNGVP